MTGTPRRPTWVVALTGLLGTSIMLGLSSSQGHDGVSRVVRTALDAPATEPLVLRGLVVPPLSPGTARPVDMTVSNPYDRAVVLTELVVSVTAVDAPEATASQPCTVDDFRTGPSRLEALVVAPRGTTSLLAAGVEEHRWPTVSMLDADHDQDGCHRASLVLSLHAVGDFA